MVLVCDNHNRTDQSAVTRLLLVEAARDASDVDANKRLPRARWALNADDALCQSLNNRVSLILVEGDLGRQMRGNKLFDLVGFRRRHAGTVAKEMRALRITRAGTTFEGA